MIKINIDNDIAEYVQTEHLKWFKKNYNENFTIDENNDEYFYKKYDKDTKTYNKIKISDPNIISFIKYINNPTVLKNIVVGKLIDNENPKNSVTYITKKILKCFPIIFQDPIKKSVRNFLASQREILKRINCSDRNNSNEFKIVKRNIQYFFKENKEILNFYIADLNDINLKIDKIKLTESTIQNFSSDKFIQFINNDTSNERIFNETLNIMSSLFNYNLFTSKVRDGEWGAYELLKQLKITTCPYCNRNYIHTYMDEQGMCRADIDHFYPKSKYPFLAVSLYNFIPSCHTCNSSFKHDIDTFLIPHVYPYEDSFGECVKFQTIPLDSDDFVQYILGNSKNFKIILNTDDSPIKEKITNSNNTFKIEKLYNLHKDYVQEIIKKARIYNDSRINELIRLYPDLFRSREELLRTIYSNYLNEEEYGKRPLSKLAKDILDEFNIKIFSTTNS